MARQHPLVPVYRAHGVAVAHDASGLSLWFGRLRCRRQDHLSWLARLDDDARLKRITGYRNLFCLSGGILKET